MPHSNILDPVIGPPPPETQTNCQPETEGAPPATQHPEAAYVREARPGDMHAVIACLTRAFATCPPMNWWGSVGQLVADVDAQDASTRRTMRNLGHFQALTAKGMVLSQGVVTVVVVPADESCPEEAKVNAPATAEKGSKKAAGAKKERVVATALWLPPGKTLDLGPVFLLRAGIHRLVLGWGLAGLKVGLASPSI